jgi:hypothetical protein
VRFYKSIYDSGMVPEGWRSAPPPGAIVKWPIRSRELPPLLRRAHPGRWYKVYHYGADDFDLHYFQHESGIVFNVKPKRKTRG